MGGRSVSRKSLHLAGHRLGDIGASAINDKGGKSLGFQTCSRGRGRPLKLAVCREPVPAALHVAVGAGHSVLVPDNEMPAEKQQARCCQRHAGVTVPGFGGADDTLAAREASPIRLSSLIQKEVWEGGDRGWTTSMCRVLYAADLI